MLDIFTSNDQEKKKNLKSWEFTGFTRDRASGRMLIMKELLQFPFECSNRGTCSNWQWYVISNLYSRIKEYIFAELQV